MTFVSVLTSLAVLGLSAASLLVFVTVAPAMLTWYVMTRRLRTLSGRFARTQAEYARTRARLRLRTERHKLTLRAINDVIFYWNVRANVLRWSVNGRRCRGWTLRSCRPWPLLKRSVDERDRDRVLQDLQAFMHRDESVWRSEFTLKGPDGAPIPVSVRGILERDALGKPWRMIGAITDMTAARAAKESARALARAAKLAAIGEVTASITHQVNQPLAAILNNSETGLLLLQRQPAAPEMMYDVLEDIRSDALRASEIVRRTRALLQDREMARERVNVNKLVADAVDLLWPQAQRRGVTLSVAPGSIPLVQGDPVHLQQVAINLIANALDATESRVNSVRRVEVSTVHQAGKVLVHVADTGCGIEPTQLETIFESFNTGKADGLGIGLSIARSIVRAHGGRIFAENNKFGPGATVSFELPISVDSPTHIRSPARQAMSGQ